MDERLRFVARLLEGERMSSLCREFGISRVTGYKLFNRYKECGLDALNDRSRRPYRHANKLPFQVERTILGIKREHASWGAPKIRDKLIRELPIIKPPAVSTIHAVLDRQGLVKRRKRRRQPSAAAPSPRWRIPRRCVYTFTSPLRATAGAGVPLSRSYRARDALRPHLHRQAQDQSKQGVRRPMRRHPRSRRPSLARHLHGLRPRVLRSG